MTKIFLDYDQQALDRAYDQKAWAGNMEEVVAGYGEASARTRRILGQPEVYAYGPSPVERLEVFRTPRDDAPIQIFVHGGAWRSGTASNYSFPAKMFVDAGLHYVALDFASIVDVGGNLDALASQVLRAIAWIHANARRFGGNGSRLFIAGHSSGAHLAAVALTADWETLGVPPDAIKGGLVISGMYDLRPVRLSARSSYVAIDDAVEQKLSPIRHLNRLSVPLVVAWGSEESPEFMRQGQALVSAVRTLGKPLERLQGDGLNHFEIMNTLARPDTPLGQAALRLTQA